MDVWTEILTEDVADVHVGDSHVVVPIADDVSERHVRQVMDAIVVREEARRFNRELREQLAQQRRMRETLEDAGYHPSEVLGP
jgi:hypothetical protein